MRLFSALCVVAAAISLLSACLDESSTTIYPADGDADTAERDVEPDAEPDAEVLSEGERESETNEAQEADSETLENEIEESERESESESQCAAGTLSCQTSSECGSPDAPVCTAGCCVAACTENDCSGARCNPNNGRCEFCGLSTGESVCAAGQCCDYGTGFWYCGTCCTPPCGEGQACIQGRCEKMRCPESCPNATDYCDAEHGWVCYDPKGGDYETSDEELLPGQMAACTPDYDPDALVVAHKAPRKALATSCATQTAAFPIHPLSNLTLSPPYVLIQSVYDELLAINENAPQNAPLLLGRHPQQVSIPRPGQVAMIEDGQLAVFRIEDLIGGGAALATTHLGRMQALLEGQYLYRAVFDNCVSVRVDTILEDGSLLKGPLRGFVPDRPFDFGGIAAAGPGAIGLWTNAIYDMNAMSIACSTIWDFYALSVTGDTSIGASFRLFNGGMSIEECNSCWPVPLWGMASEGRLLALNPANCVGRLGGGYCFTSDYTGAYRPQPEAAPILLGSLPTDFPARSVKEWQGDTLWAAKDKDLTRYDFADYATPLAQSTSALPYETTALKVGGEKAYSLSTFYGLQVLDLSAPQAPTLLFSRNLSLPFWDNVGDLFFSHGLLWAYVGSTLYGLDAAHPETGEPLAIVPLNAYGPLVAQTEGLLIIGDYDALDIFDMSQPQAPKRVFSGVPAGVANPTSRKGLRAPISGSGRVVGTTLYTALDILAATDLSVPEAPVRLWSLEHLDFGPSDTVNRPHSLQVIGERLVAVFEQNGRQAFVVLDLQSFSPATAERRLTGEFSAIGWQGPLAVTLTKRDPHAFLQLIDFSDPQAPVLGPRVERPDLDTASSGIIEKDGLLYIAADDNRSLHVLDPQNPTRDRLTISMAERLEAFAASGEGPQVGLVAATICQGCEHRSPYSLALYDTQACATKRR